MSEPPSEKPPKQPTEETAASLVRGQSGAKRALFPFGLSAEQFTTVTRNMLKVARAVCRHSGASPADAVQQAWVKALLKPSTERPSTDDETKFVAWMGALARCEALTKRQTHRRLAQREVESDAEFAEMVVVPPFVGAVEARRMLERAFITLEPEDQALLHGLYVEGKTMNEIALERQQPWTTVKSRWQRLMALLYATIQAAMVALVLLLPKKARAFVAHVKQRTSHMLLQTTQFGGAMAVTAVCGVLLPTGSSVMTDPSTTVGLTPYNHSPMTLAQAPTLQPSFVSEVEPEEPKALDAETNRCSAVDMKSTKISSFLQGTVLPLALSAAPALTQAACVGKECQTPPAQQPEEERDDSPDPYDVMCDQQRARGKSCPPRETWGKW